MSSYETAYFSAFAGDNIYFPNHGSYRPTRYPVHADEAHDTMLSAFKKLQEEERRIRAADRNARLVGWWKRVVMEKILGINFSELHWRQISVLLGAEHDNFYTNPIKQGRY